MKHLVSFLVIIFLLFTSQPAHAFLGKAIYKVTVKVFGTEVGEEILYFFGSKALRKGIKNIECLNGEWKLVLKDKAFVYEQPDLSSDVRGKYDPEERICVKDQTQDWGKTTLGWLEKKYFNLKKEDSHEMV